MRTKIFVFTEDTSHYHVEQSVGILKKFGMKPDLQFIFVVLQGRA